MHMYESEGKLLLKPVGSRSSCAALDANDTMYMYHLSQTNVWLIERLLLHSYDASLVLHLSQTSV